MAGAITLANFAAYPPTARAIAIKHLPRLQMLPPAFGALLMSEIIGYDWRFPAERADIDRQLSFLGSLDEAGLKAAMEGFAGLSLSPALQQMRWAAVPAEFIEKLTAHLWSVHQMDRFRELALAYQHALAAAQAEPAPAVARLCIVVIGKDATPGAFNLFQKLRPEGTYFNRVKAEGGLDSLLAAVQMRAQTHAEAYAHWYVDGGAVFSKPSDSLHTISYERLQPVRSELLSKVNAARTSGDAVGPESLRSLLATLRPEQLGAASGDDAIQRHFELSLLTEGSGTQIFSTTFVQWAGRELLRRARPLTLVLRYAPRQAERSMNEMLRPDAPAAQPDALGSLVDADMGAFYTWLNLMRLPGAEQASFVAWFEDQHEALAVGPAMARGATSTAPCDLTQILKWAS